MSSTMAIMDPSNARTMVTTTTVGSDVGLDVNMVGGVAPSPAVTAMTTTTPTVATATSVTLLAANASRKYLFIQNGTAANIMVSLTGAVLTGIVPTATNIGIVIPPFSAYESPTNVVSGTAITVYQTSGATVNTIVAVEA